MTVRMGLDIVRPKIDPLDRMSLTRAPARDLGHMTSPAAPLRMRSRYTISGSRRRQTACLHTNRHGRFSMS